MVSHFNIYLALLCFLKGYNPLLLKTQSRHQNKGMPPAEAHEGRHFWFNSAGIPTNDLLNKKYKKKQNNLGPINSTLRQLSDASNRSLFCSVVPSAGEKTELRMEELRRITNVGSKTPVYLLCLTELKRMTHVGGARDTSVYKLCTRS